MKMKIARIIVIALTSVALATAQEKAVAGEAGAGGEAKQMVDAMAAIGSAITGVGSKAEAAAETTETATAEKKARSSKNSVILITGGAAAGAAIGAALGKDSKAAMIGAAVGGVAGLIYDRMTYKNPGKI